MAIELNQEEIKFIKECLDYRIEKMEVDIKNLQKMVSGLDKNIRFPEKSPYILLLGKYNYGINYIKKIKEKIDAC
jgi:hypothetical protein